MTDKRHKARWFWALISPLLASLPDFIVPDVAAAVRRAEAAGARLEEEIRTHEWGRIAVMADPFGHGFCLIEFVGRGYDALATS